MKDPYQKAFDQVAEALNTLRDMIFELAKRTLTIKEYEEYAETLNKKKSDDETNQREVQEM